MQSLTIRLLVTVIVAATLFACGEKPQTAKIEPPKRETCDSKASFLAVGDIMLSRGVAQIMNSAGYDRPFRELKDLFRSVDITFGNLESPISGNDSRLGKGLVFNTAKAHTAGLKEFNFGILSLANNHSMDQGLAGLKYTRTYLDELGIKHTGTGDDLSQAWTGSVVDLKGIKVGFIATSYASINDGGVAKNNYVARIEDRENLKRSIAKLKTEADIVVVSMHAGIEYTRKPHQPQIDFARAAIDDGADIIIGAHPHWVQTIENYRGKYIFYSLGNFIFDQRQPGTTDGLAVRVSAECRQDSAPNESKARISGIEIIPIVMEQKAIPRLATPQESARILGGIGVTERQLVPQN